MNQLTKRGNENYSYDLNGNLIEKSGGRYAQTYHYDAFDRLIAVVIDGKEIRYFYDAFNRRLLKKEGGAVDKQFIYFGQEEMGVKEGDVMTELKVLRQGKRYPAVAIELNQAVYTPIYDLFGNIICLNDFQGKVIERYRHSAFGELK